MDDERLRALAAFLEPRRAVAARHPEAAAFPTGVRVIDAALEALRVEPERIRNPQRDHLAGDERVHAVEQVRRRHRNVRAKAGRVVLVDPAVIARLDALVGSADEPRTRITIEAPAFGAVVAGRAWTVQRAFALAPV